MSGPERERMWLLKTGWGNDGWTSACGLTDRGAKWRGHRDRLVRDGLLEQSENCLMWRITDAGRAALARIGGE